MLKKLIVPVALALAISACGKAEKEDATQEAKIQMQADKARLDLQEKANALARNPPPELVEAAKAKAPAEVAKTAESK